MNNENSISVYFKEIKNLNKRCKEVLKCVKDYPNKNSEQIMELMGTTETNKVNPRLSDLYNKGLVQVGKGLNHKGHKVNTYRVTEHNEFKPKMNSDLRIILDKLGKLSQDELSLLSDSVRDKQQELNK